MKAIAVSVLALASLLADGQTIGVGKDPQEMIFSADGRALAISCENGIYVYNIPMHHIYRCPSGTLSDISSDGSKVAISDDVKGLLTIWGVPQQRILRSFEKYREPDGATFSPDGNEIILASGSGGDERSVTPLVRINISTGATTEYSKWCRPLALPIAKMVSQGGQFFKTTPKQVTYSYVGIAMRWNSDGTIEDAIRYQANREIAYALFTMRLQDQRPYRVMIGYGLFYLWNGDYLRLEGGPEKVSIIRWHEAKEHVLAKVHNLGDGNEEGDPGIYPSRNTPWVLVYGIRHFAHSEHPTKGQLSRQRLNILLLNSQTGKVQSLLNTRYPWYDTKCALSPNAKLIAYRSPRSANAVMLRQIR